MDGLWLVTCYPFDAIVPGGPLRYVVQARRLNLNATAGRFVSWRGNQTGTARSELVIGTVPLPWNVPVRPSTSPFAAVTAQPIMVFPLTSPTTFIPAQPFTASGFLCVRCGDGQPIALRMAAISAR